MTRNSTKPPASAVHGVARWQLAEWPLGRHQLALRFGTCSWFGALLQRDGPEQLVQPSERRGFQLLPGGQPRVDLSSLTPDQEFQAGISCDGVNATPTAGFSSCDNAGYKSNLVTIPAPGTENDDHNPPRIAPRSLFDVNMGKTNLFRSDRYKVDFDVTAVNVTKSSALQFSLDF